MHSCTKHFNKFIYVSINFSNVITTRSDKDFKGLESEHVKGDYDQPTLSSVGESSNTTTTSESTNDEVIRQSSSVESSIDNNTLNMSSSASSKTVTGSTKPTPTSRYIATKFKLPSSYISKMDNVDEPITRDPTKCRRYGLYLYSHLCELKSNIFMYVYASSLRRIYDTAHAMCALGLLKKEEICIDWRDVIHFSWNAIDLNALRNAETAVLRKDLQMGNNEDS